MAGRQLLELRESNVDETAETCLLQDILQPKATSTLHSRADSLLLFARWKQLQRADATLFPILEPECYDYLCCLRAEQKAPTRASRFLEAVHFSGGVLGFPLDQFNSSARLHGVVKSIETFRKERVKRDPLSRDQVMALEVALLSFELEPHLLVFIGFLLFLLYTRCRFSDTK